jgi:putative transcriptional regulator
MEMPVRGDVLIAPPQMLDSRFENAVILLTHRDIDGTWGLIINKPAGTTTQALFSRANIDCDLDIELFWGGPVSPGVIWMLHDSGWSMDNTLDLEHGWSMTSNPKMFKKLKEEGFPKHWRLFYGFSAWAPDQLEAEIQGTHPWSRDHSWLWAQSLGPEWAFDQDPENLWEHSLQLSGQQAVSSWLS